jgi:hypothetical protein
MLLADVGQVDLAPAKCGVPSVPLTCRYCRTTRLRLFPSSRVSPEGQGLRAAVWVVFSWRRHITGDPAVSWKVISQSSPGTR